ncbi:hypothetical protein BJY01DRAFT_116979 [Aspergillus pseudoustus]|uniref:Zn(2)-C6 fungal-type domain-containing protein n=1 Tax=Aspergillus pseudoustus TaxID=1810923 RepID=A0ABR4KGU0_9EURO
MEYEAIRPAVRSGKHRNTADSPQTACLRCRSQKLKCSRTRPKCDRCFRKGANCQYPLPPDRKELAAYRDYHKRKLHDGSQNSSSSDLQSPVLSIRCDPSTPPTTQPQVRR